jgi:signal transduction histidine kinase
VTRDVGLLPAAPKLFPTGTTRLPTEAALKLGPVRQRVDFAFSAPAFSAPENVHFRHRLEGYDGEWTEAGPQRSASYARLPAGSYRFLVEARNSDGVWSERPAALAVVIAPFYWQTWWFQLFAVAGFTAVTAFVVRRVSHQRLQRNVRELRQQMALEKERARIARDLHDDAGNRLTRVLLLSKLALREREHPERTAAHLTQLSDAAREANAALDEVVWAVNPHNDTLPELAERLAQFANELCQPAGIACVLELPPQIPERNVPTDVRHNLFLAAKEAIHNAVQHAQANEVRFRVEVSDTKLVMTVADNGRGLRSGGSERGEDGLRNLRARMEEIGGRLEIESTSGAGTRLVFSYPWPAK